MKFLISLIILIGITQVFFDILDPSGLVLYTLGQVAAISMTYFYMKD